MTTQGRKVSLEIALCLSGGGYRAAAFHLGVLSYLNRIQLLESVTILSTVSGGTLTGLSYAQSLKSETSFEEFYKKLYAFLRDVKLIQLSLADLGTASKTELHYKNVITSVADIYDRKLFSGERFGLFWNKTKIHLKDLIFNSTEFRTGIDFRFQKSDSEQAKIGNHNIEISVYDAMPIRLGDIAAASSCFPAGFEPLAFPQDFQWPENKIPVQLAERFPKPLPLMDGGIYDNQGIEAALLAIERRKRKEKDFSLFIISDTDQKKPDIYRYPKGGQFSRLTVSAVNIILLIFITLSLLSALTLVAGLVNHVCGAGGWWTGLLKYGFPAVVLISLAAAIWWIRNKVKNEFFARIPQVSYAGWDDIKRLTIDQLLDLVELRATSVVALTSSVFMKRIRSLIYGIVYRDEKFKDKRVSNLIYELNGEKASRVSWLKPSEEMQKVTQLASNEPTRLWFENEEEQKNLIACGQYTICYNLLDYVVRVYGTNSSKYPAWVKELFPKVKKNWEELRKNPKAYLS